MTGVRLVLLLGVVSMGCRTDTAPPPADSSIESGVRPLLTRIPQPQIAGALRIAAIFPMAGRFAVSGIQSHNGARLAIDDLNGRGGIHGRRVELLAYGTGSYFLDAAHAARLATSDGALALIGANASSLSKAVADIAESEGIVQISNVSTAHDLTWDPSDGTERPFVFRVCGSDTVMGRGLARFAKETLAARRAAILYEVGRTYSARLTAQFARDFVAGGQVDRSVEEFFYLPLETDFRTQLRQIARFAPEVIFIPGSFTDASLVARQARALGMDSDTVLLGADGWSNTRLFAGGGPTGLAYHADHCSVDDAFQERYAREFATEMDGCRAALAYDAVMSAATALEEIGPLSQDDLTRDVMVTRRQLRDRLTELNLDGMGGAFRFDSHGDGIRQVAMFVVESDAGKYAPRLLRWLGAES